MPKILLLIISYALSSFLVRFFSALGIGIFTYKGLMSLIEALLAHIQPLLNSLPSSIISLFAIAGVFEALSIIVSALLTRTAINTAKAFIGVVA